MVSRARPWRTGPHSLAGCGGGAGHLRTGDALISRRPEAGGRYRWRELRGTPRVEVDEAL